MTVPAGAAMSIPDEQLDELVAIFTAVENGAVEAGAISFADAVEGALPAVVAKVRADERAKAAEQFAAYRCDYELCGMCTCRADLVKLLRGDS